MMGINGWWWNPVGRLGRRRRQRGFLRRLLAWMLFGRRRRGWY